MRILGLAATLAVLVFAVPLGGSSATGVTTCLMRPEPDPWKRVELAATSAHTQLVMVGEVVRERRTELAPGGYRELDYDASVVDGAYWSLVRLDARLYGEAPEGLIGLPGRYMQWQCGGGPRLREGDQVLLFLHRDQEFEAYPDGYVWNTEPLGGQIVFRDGEAYLTDYQATGELDPRAPGEHLGSADGVIDRVAAWLGTGAMDTAAAQEAAARSSYEPGPPSSLTLLAMAIVSTAILAGLGTALVRRRVRSDSIQG